jgi:hypothetical protein
MNYSRIFLGGLVAGVVANVCDAAIAFVTAEDMERMVQRLSLDRARLNSTSTMLSWILIDFIYATIIVFTYAAIRPRFGPGPKTAIIGALMIYGAVTLILFGFQRMGFFTPDLFLKNALLSLVTAVLAGLVGARVYREAPGTGGTSPEP